MIAHTPSMTAPITTKLRLRLRQTLRHARIGNIIFYLKRIREKPLH